MVNTKTHIAFLKSYLFMVSNCASFSHSTYEFNAKSFSKFIGVHSLTHQVFKMSKIHAALKEYDVFISH